MKFKTLLLSLILSLFILSGCSGDEASSGLSFGLKVGETYKILIDRDIKNYQMQNGSFVNLNQNFCTGYIFEPTEITSEGTTKLKVTIASLKINYDGTLGKIVFDSEAKNSGFSILEKPFLNLLNKPFSVDILKDGTVISVTGMEPILTKTAASLKVTETFIKNALVDLLSDNFSDNELKETFSRMLAFYPGKVVAMGDKWNKSFSIKQVQPLKADAEFQLLERSNGISIIEMNSVLKTDTTKFKPTDYSIEGSQKGKLQVDEITGWVTRAHFEYEMHALPIAGADSLSKNEKLISSELSVKYEPFANSAFRDIKFAPSAVSKGDGWAMTIVGMGVVFSSLVLLYLMFSYVSTLINKKQKSKPAETLQEVIPVKVTQEELTGEVNAAIAAALYFYSQELHDNENTVLTIEKVSRTYSPWSSKIYGLRQNPR